MKAYKIEVLVIDFDNLGKDRIVEEMTDVRFANDCINLQIKDVAERDIGEWSDDHPLNNGSTCDEEYDRLFPMRGPRSLAAQELLDKWEYVVPKYVSESEKLWPYNEYEDFWPHDVNLDDRLQSTFGCLEVEQAAIHIIKYFVDRNLFWNTTFGLDSFPEIKHDLFALMCATGWIKATWFPTKYTFVLSREFIKRLKLKQKSPTIFNMDFD